MSIPFADWMCKDPKEGTFLRADHLVENLLEGRLKGNKAARGIAMQEDRNEKNLPDAEKDKGRVRDIKAAKLDDSIVTEYEQILNPSHREETTHYKHSGVYSKCYRAIVWHRPNSICLLEHIYWQRPGDVLVEYSVASLYLFYYGTSMVRHPNSYTSEGLLTKVLSFPPQIAHTNVLIVPLSTHPDFTPVIKRISSRLRTIGIQYVLIFPELELENAILAMTKLDTPLAVTIDVDSVKNGSITLRERDSTKQVRASEYEIL